MYLKQCKIGSLKKRLSICPKPIKLNTIIPIYTEKPSSLIFAGNTPWPFLQHSIYQSSFPPYCQIAVPCFRALNERFLSVSYPIPMSCLPPSICPAWFRIFGRFSSFQRVFRSHRSALPPLRSQRVSSLLCVLLLCASA